MKICTKYIIAWLDAHPKIKEWCWFIALWIGGITTCWAVAYPIKFIIKKYA